MPRVITITNQKGGVGKTTVCLNLYSAFSENLKVVIIDMDKQQSAKQINSATGGQTYSVQAFESVRQILELDCDLVLIDTPPYLTTNLPETLAVSDVVLAPTKTGYLDVLALYPTAEMIFEAQKTNPKLKAFIVLNMVGRSKIADELKEHIDAVGLPVLDAKLHERVSYARSPIHGGVYEQGDSKAQNEVNRLAMAVYAELSK